MFNVVDVWVLVDPCSGVRDEMPLKEPIQTMVSRRLVAIFVDSVVEASVDDVNGALSGNSYAVASYVVHGNLSLPRSAQHTAQG